eukprot:TRINITY_DN6399_c0_g1_i3.p1 TRINITY_DN6399_c0_g1~~TRINITY_DN6399_c0_g1_i3.p1  ORF type:complete len:183 (-),score=34.24 TRINITY_DN6399_c0_g1_i3:180-728(-)
MKSMYLLVLHYLFRNIQRITIQNLVFACVAVLVCLMLFLDLRTAFIVTLCVVLIDVNIFGIIMTGWDVPLDAASFICLAMAVGLSVDYCAHIAIAYFNHGGSREDMTIGALTEIGPSVLNGGISTLLGISMLAFTTSEGFRIFFKMMFGIILFGLLHGLILFPVLISIFGPRRGSKSFLNLY